ncbi:MAG: hypothetical protein ACKVP7_01850 [Hyphomicrobiaceae bacterium]
MKRNGEVASRSNTKEHPVVVGRRGTDEAGARPADLKTKKSPARKTEKILKNDKRSMNDRLGPLSFSV